MTILELLLSLSFLGVVAAMAAPNLSAFYQRQQIAAGQDNINQALSLARTTALSEVTPVQVCWNSTTSAKTVSGYSLAAGELGVFIDDLDGTFSSDEVLRQFDYVGGLFIDDNETDDCLRFDDQGRLETASIDNSTLIFGVCRKAGDTKDSQSIVLSQVGRAITRDNVSSGGTTTIDCS